MTEVQEIISTIRYFYHFPYPELLERAKKESITDLQASLRIGPDVRDIPKDLFLHWQRDIKAASQTPGRVPPEAMDYFQKTKHLRKPPVAGDVELGTGEPLEPVLLTYGEAQGNPPQECTALLAEQAAETLQIIKGQQRNLTDEKPLKQHPNPPRFTWSYSSLQDFENCPRSFAAKRYFKTVKEPESEQKRWGNEVHKGLELRVKGTSTADPRLLPYYKYADAFISARAKGAEVLVENQIAMTEDLKHTEWFGKTAWGRGVIDVAVVKDGVGKIYDYKTGAIKEDPTQLKIFCLFLSIIRPEIERFESRFIWLKEDKISPPMLLDKKGLSEVWSEVLGKVKRMREAWDNEVFSARTSGLCKAWCHEMTCPHNGKRK